MSARKRSALKCFDRRRNLILEKGFHLIHNELDTGLGKFITQRNELERKERRRLFTPLLQQEAITKRHEEQRIRKYVLNMETNRAEPALVIHRTAQTKYVQQLESSSENIPEHVYRNWPHYRWPTTSHSISISRSSTPAGLSTVDLYCADRPRTCRQWDRQAKRPTLKIPQLNTTDHSDDEATIEKQLKAVSFSLGAISSAEQQTRFRSIVNPSLPLNGEEKQNLLHQWMNLRRQQRLDDDTRAKLLDRCKSPRILVTPCCTTTPNSSTLSPRSNPSVRPCSSLITNSEYSPYLEDDVHSVARANFSFITQLSTENEY